jgi:hypothetical protein
VSKATAGIDSLLLYFVAQSKFGEIDLLPPRALPWKKYRDFKEKSQDRKIETPRRSLLIKGAM